MKLSECSPPAALQELISTSKFLIFLTLSCFPKDFEGFSFRKNQKETPSKSLGKQANVRKIKKFDVEINSCKATGGEHSLSFILQQKSSKSIYKQKNCQRYSISPSKPRNNTSYGGVTKCTCPSLLNTAEVQKHTQKQFEVAKNVY